MTGLGLAGIRQIRRVPTLATNVVGKEMHFSQELVFYKRNLSCFVRSLESLSMDSRGKEKHERGIVRNISLDWSI